MKKTMILGLAMAIAGAAFAYPSLLGPTGGVALPTADTACKGQFNVSANYLFNGNDFRNYAPVATGIGYEETYDFSDTVNFALLYGVTPNLEVGVNYNNQAEDMMARLFDEETGETIVMNGVYQILYGSADLSNWGFNAKYAFNNVFAGANVALGGLYQTYSFNDQNIYQLYAVATKAFTEAGEGAVGFRGSLGVNYTNVSRTLTGKDEDGNTVEVDVDNNATRVFASVDATFANNLSLSAEYQTKKNDLDEKAISSIGLRYPFFPSLIGQVAYSNSFRGIAGNDEHKLLVGLDFLFGGEAE